MKSIGMNGIAKRLLALILCFALAGGTALATEEFLVEEELPTAVPAPAEGVTITIASPEAQEEALLQARDPAKDGVYSAAVQMLEDGSLIDALNQFAKLGSYLDSVQNTDYTSALLTYRRNDPGAAAESFAALGSFRDAAFYKRLCVLMAVHRFYKDGQFGYVDLNGTIKIEPAYDWAERVFRDESRAPMVSGDMLSEENALLPVAAVFEGTVEATAADLVPKEGKYGLLRRDGQLIVPMRYDEVLWAKDGVAALRDGEQTVLYNLVSGALLGKDYESAQPISQGLTAVCENGLWGYVNSMGEVLAPGFVWDSALPFTEGLAGVVQKKKAGFIDTKGNTVIALAYQAVHPFGEGLAGYRFKNRWGFLNAKGETVIEPQYADTGVFERGVCPIKRNGNWGMIDTQANLLLKCKYDEITPLDPIYHRAWMRNQKLWGICSDRGEVVLIPAWGTYTDFGAEGVSRVSYRGKFGYIDTSGATRIPNDYDLAAPFSAGYGGVLNEQGQTEYLNKLSRGFIVDSDIPTEALCGFLEGRKVSAEVNKVLDEAGNAVLDKEGNEEVTYTYGIAYRLYAVDGSAVTVWGK
ncbi:MAG: WG repeat-containing protein [Clostridia bacterium]